MDRKKNTGNNTNPSSSSSLSSTPAPTSASGSASTSTSTSSSVTTYLSSISATGSGRERPRLDLPTEITNDKEAADLTSECEKLARYISSAFEGDNFNSPEYVIPAIEKFLEYKQGVAFFKKSAERAKRRVSSKIEKDAKTETPSLPVLSEDPAFLQALLIMVKAPRAILEGDFILGDSSPELYERYNKSLSKAGWEMIQQVLEKHPLNLKALVSEKNEEERKQMVNDFLTNEDSVRSYMGIANSVFESKEVSVEAREKWIKVAAALVCLVVSAIAAVILACVGALIGYGIGQLALGVAAVKVLPAIDMGWKIGGWVGAGGGLLGSMYKAFDFLPEFLPQARIKTSRDQMGTMANIVLKDYLKSRKNNT